MARTPKTSIASKMVRNSVSKRRDSYLKRGMYTSLTIEGFRQFDKFRLENLARINLFFGGNNSGKTSLLEAVFTHACGLNIAPFATVITRRHGNTISGPLDYGEKVISIFRDRKSPPYKFCLTARVDSDSLIHKTTTSFSPSAILSDLDPRELAQYSRQIHTDSADSRFSGTVTQLPVSQPFGGGTPPIQPVSIGLWKTSIEGQEPNEIELMYPPEFRSSSAPFKWGHLDDILEHRNPGADLKIYGALKRYGVLDDFTKEITAAFPHVRGFDIIPYADGTASPVYELNKHGRLPLYTSGDGLRRWFHVLGNMIVFQNACHLLEEIEATLHPEAQRRFSRALVEYAKRFNNQVFLTSHSIEFADNFLNAIYSDSGTDKLRGADPVRVYTLKPVSGGQPDIWSISGREAFERRRDFDLELR